MREIAKSRPKDSVLAASKVAAENRKSLFSKQPWLNPNADKGIWGMSDQIYKMYLENSAIGTRALGSVLNIKFSKLRCVLNKIRSGWVPNECPFWTKTFILKEE